MLNSWITIGICTFLFGFILASFFAPATASNGKKSWTLNGLRLLTVAVLCVVLLDTLNDRRLPTPKLPKIPQASAATKSNRPKRPRRGSNKKVVRPVSKEKYEILGFLWLGFAILYMLSHKLEQWSDTVLRLIMAGRKMDPFAGRDELDKFIMRQLEDNFDSVYHHEWFLRALLAKKGEASAVAATDTLINGRGAEEPIIDEPEVPPGMAPPGTDEEDLH